MKESSIDRRQAIEDRLAAPMFLLAALFLILLAALIHYARASEQGIPWDTQAGLVVTIATLVLWPVFLAEAVFRYYLTPPDRRTRKTLGLSLFVGLLPPLRLAAHSHTRPDRLWLPGVGWREIDFDLNKTLERVFSGPMFFMALLILPVLAVEYFWSDAVEGSPLLQAVLGIGVSVIWIAFAVEFVIRCSAAEKKIAYSLEHWIDVVVVLLPLLEFLPFLRLLRATRVVRLKTILRMSKYYRIYGLAGKGWQGVVVLELIRRGFSRSPEARLSRLKGHLEEKREQIRELEREADYYRRKIEAVEKELSEQEDL